jgi:hypothetical protein
VEQSSWQSATSKFIRLAGMIDGQLFIQMRPGTDALFELFDTIETPFN